MFFKIVKNDFLRKKITTATVFLFITIAVILGASATNIIAGLIQSIADFKKAAMPADIAQMHAGTIDRAVIDKFTREQQENIAMQETMTLLNYEGINIRFHGNETMSGTVQDILFVVQNKKFDFILDLNNEKLAVRQGEIAVPVYFMQEYDLKIGETVTLVTEEYSKEFLIAEYARDFAMNPSLTSSKRFVVNQADFDELYQKYTGEPEYIIEFILTETGDAEAVQTAYINAGLPANGPMVGGMMFTIFNAMSDAALAMVIILISILLVIIAALCIRLTFLATIDEDLREIGVMKAIGISKTDIRKVYLGKYKIMTLIGGVVGYLLSFAVVNLFTGNMRLYLSTDLSGNFKFLLSLIVPVAVYFLIGMYSNRVLQRIDKISAAEALQANIFEKTKNKKYTFPLLKNRFFSTNMYMGLRDVGKRHKLYRPLFVIFIISTFIIILPLNIFNTMNSSEFSTYMGIGKSDMRIDLRRSETITEDFQKLQENLKNDSDIEKYAAYITSSYQVKNAEGSWDYINIEIGDFAVFPLSYLEGRAPENAEEISLSYANALPDVLDKKVGDEVVIKHDGTEKTLKVSGIYQDITNGGKTAKAGAGFSVNENAVLWYIVSADLVSGADIDKKMEHYRKAYPNAQVNNLKEYTEQTLGNIISQMGRVVVGGIITAVITIVMITALFIKMLLSKDMSQIAIMRSVGLTTKNIRHQYMAGMMLVLILGIILGVLASNILGEVIVSAVMSPMGVAGIKFVDVIWQTWILCPSVLIAIVGYTISLCCNLTIVDDISVVLRN